jgi:hypothetical protein
MPNTSRAFIRASILYLAVGVLLGALLLINRWLLLSPTIAALRTSHVEALIVGWLIQLIMGVGWWLFPPLAIGLRPNSPLPVRRGQAQRGSDALFWATFVCLNVGILLAAIFDPVYRWTNVEVFCILASISGVFMLAAAIAFVVNTWGRIRELGRGKSGL